MYGVPVEVVKKISKPLIDDLAAVTGTPRDYFSIQVCQDLFIFDDSEVKPDPFVELSLFERGESIEDTLVNKVTEHLVGQGFRSVEVYINHLTRRRYFENGKHFHGL
jgi:hypothetical protein